MAPYEPIMEKCARLASVLTESEYNYAGLNDSLCYDLARIKAEYDLDLTLCPPEFPWKADNLGSAILEMIYSAECSPMMRL